MARVRLRSRSPRTRAPLRSACRSGRTHPGSKQTFTDWLDVRPNGPLNLSSNEVNLRLTPLGATSKSLNRLGGAPVSIPGHTTYIWKVTVQATKDFPANDVGFGLRVGILAPDTNPFTIIKQDAWFHVGTRAKPGYIVESLKGATTLGPRHPALETFTVTNRSGVRVDQPLTVVPMLHAYDRNVSLALDEWVGSGRTGHWQQVRTVTVPRGLANGATYTVKLRVRVRVTHDSSKARFAGGSLEMFDTDVNGQPAWQDLVVLRNG
ncbi:hypothetical protein ABIA32_000257 [Streptacidiphilus sp. MAP12-20]|uniref:hypothetical protein n=1 Tax=Streptacidiphilus sp. MAP12-20 TaxID=3156299 RepID=UPI003514275A